MKVAVTWASQNKDNNKVYWGGVASICNVTLLFKCVDHSIKILSRRDTKACNIKLNKSLNGGSVLGVQALCNNVHSRVCKRQLLSHFATAYKKAKFQRSTTDHFCLSDRYAAPACRAKMSRMFPEQRIVSSTCTYLFANKPCEGGDCKVSGTTPLVKAGNSYWTCKSCAKMQALNVLATTCQIADDNKAPSKAVKKKFVATGGTIKYATSASCVAKP